MELWGKYALLKVRPSVAVILMHHIIKCDDAENDADRTVKELMDELDFNKGRISKSCMESALYCCNMEDEKGKFWHPLGWSFQKFLNESLAYDLAFDRYYNLIHEKRAKEKKP